MAKWCDLTCEYAAFPKDYGLDGAGSCRTFVGLYCAKLKRIVAKNAPCPAQGAAKEHKEKDAGTKVPTE